MTDLPEVRLPPLSLPRWGLRLSERRALLVAGDLVCALAATLAALWLWTLTSGAHFSLTYLAEKAIWFAILGPGWLLLSIPLYDLRRAAFWQLTIAGLIASAGLAVLVYLAAYFLAPPLLLPVEPVTSAAPSQPLTSPFRCMIPVRSWCTSRR